MSGRTGKARGGPNPRKVASPARPTQSRRGMLLAGAALVAVLAVVVAAGVLYQRSQSQPINDGYGTSRSAAVTVSDGVVRVGAVSAPVTLELFEDFLCPNCGAFETVYGQQLAQSLDQGTVAINYHFLDFLNDRSASKDYSSRAAGAALCVTQDGSGSAFPAFHAALYAGATQPKESSGSDLSNAQLAAVAAGVGASTSAQQCITAGAETAAARTASQAGQTALQASGNQVATPTVLNGSTKINTNDRNWLSKLP